MGGFALDDTVGDLTSLMLTPGSPITNGSFSQVYRRTIGANEDTKEVAVKVFKIDPGRTLEKHEKAMRRELKVWLRLSKHPTIVPLLGIAHVGSPFPALISQWMPSGTLYMYLEQGTISAFAKVELAMGVAEGLKYLHSENVVHGDLQPANVLIDGSGNPRLTGFDLATVVGDPELQLTTTSVDHSIDVRWRAPELIGVDYDPEMPTFESDIYSFGSVMFFTISGDIPWKEKKHFYQICIELSRRVTPARPENILDDLWNLIQRCWSWNPGDRPGAARIIEYIDQSRNADLQASISNPLPLPILLPLAKDLTGQIFGTINDYVASGAFGNVYRCEWRRPSGPVKVAVKAFRHRMTSEQDLRRFRRETAIWAHLVHDNIATLYGTTERFGPNTALVSRWFPDGTLLRLITEQGTALSIEPKLNLLHGIACGLNYLHSIPIVHGDIASSNVLVDIKDGEYKACLTDFGLSNVLGGLLEDRVTEGSIARPGATRWTAPELLMPHDSPCDIKPTTQNDMYSFGRVMFHVLTLVIPWHDVDEFKVVRKILSGEEVLRPETSATTSDITDARWNQIQQCWSSDASARPSAFMAMDFLKSELEALTDGGMPVSGMGESGSNATHDAEQRTASIDIMHPTRSRSKAVQSGRGQRSLTALVNTLTLSGFQRGPSLGRTVTITARSDTVHDDHCTLKQQDAGHLTGNTKVLRFIDQSRDNGPQSFTLHPPTLPIVPLAEDLTGQIFGAINDYVASGAFGNVYRCEWRRPSGPVKVAVKIFKHHMMSEQELRRFRRETAIWAHLIHDNIVTLYGTTEGFGPTTALVSRWFPDGTLFRLITEQGARLSIESKLYLLHGIASGLYYLHSFPVIHGDITSSNVMVDIKDGKYRACLADFGLSNMLGGLLRDHVVEGLAVRPGAARWTAPELFMPHGSPCDIKPTMQNDMYSFGRVMFHVLTLVIPWHGVDEYKVVKKIQSGEDISRPQISEATSDVTDARWNYIEHCWSIDPSGRPCAFKTMKFIKGELEALEQDDVLVGGLQESHQNAYLVAEQAGISTVPSLQSSSRTLVPSRKIIPSSPLTHRIFSTVSSLSLAGPLNVLLFGETGVGKSSIVNLIVGRDVAQTSPDAETCTLQHTSHEVSLGGRRFKLWEVSSIESMGFFRALFLKWRLKKSYKKLYKDDGVYLLLYCMRGSRAQRALIRDYKFFTDIVGTTATVAGGVPVAAVVTSLEDYPKDMDNWWTKKKDVLESLGMRFSAHACITSLPDNPNAPPAMRARRHRSEQAIRSLIYNSYQAGAETPRFSSPALTI